MDLLAKCVARDPTPTLAYVDALGEIRRRLDIVDPGLANAATAADLQEVVVRHSLEHPAEGWATACTCTGCPACAFRRERCAGLAAIRDALLDTGFELPEHYVAYLGLFYTTATRNFLFKPGAPPRGL